MPRRIATLPPAFAYHRTQTEQQSSMATLSVPSISSEGNLTRYLQEIRKFPMLEPGQEYMLAKRWKEHEDPEAAHKLVTSHLRLVARQNGYHGGAKEALLQSAQAEGSAAGDGGRRPLAREFEKDRDRARCARGGRRQHEP